MVVPNISHSNCNQFSQLGIYPIFSLTFWALSHSIPLKIISFYSHDTSCPIIICFSLTSVTRCHYLHHYCLLVKSVGFRFTKNFLTPSVQVSGASAVQLLADLWGPAAGTERTLPALHGSVHGAALRGGGLEADMENGHGIMGSEKLVMLKSSNFWV
jgi:hypothetical protein